MYRVIFLQCQLNLFSSFVHTNSLSDMHAHTHKLCNTVCVKMFQYSSAVVG